jgi:hypothetical protein
VPQAILVEYDLPSNAFGSDAVRAVVDLKWRTYGRAILKVEFLLHILTLALMTMYSSMMHNPYSIMYTNNSLPATGRNPPAPTQQLGYLPPPPVLQVSDSCTRQGNRGMTIMPL